MNIIRRSDLLPSSSFFDDFLTKDLFDWSGWTNDPNSVPRVNIIESNDEFWVEMAAPGLSKDYFNIQLDNDMLTIESHYDGRSKEDELLSYTRKEFSYKSFKRSFYLPNTIQAEKITANYENGVLKLVIPKKEEAKKKPVKRIKIS